MDSTMMNFQLSAKRLGPSGSVVSAKDATLEIDPSLSGRPDALNPVELLLAALAACMIKGIERVAGTIGVTYGGVHVELSARRPKEEARIEDIEYLVTVETESDQSKLDLLHKNLMKHGTLYNTVKLGTKLSGKLVSENQI